jgi:hypothetical protein
MGMARVCLNSLKLNKGRNFVVFLYLQRCENCWFLRQKSAPKLELG